MKFEIKEDFMIDGEPTRLVSGALHYFRVVPEMWEHSLYNLKAMGCNTVETYVPWNMHEPKKGEFNFEGLANIEQFLQTAQDLGLYIILRPAVYICAEWDFGGLPAWLIKDRNLRVRSQHVDFMNHVDDYLKELISKVDRFQFTNGGNILMMQVENEYGSFGEDTNYLRKTAEIMKKHGVTVPLFTSDGGWPEVLNAGALGEDGILATANFGSKAEENFKHLKNYQDKHGLKHPLMCMEFWDGWFDYWGRDRIVRDPKETAAEAREVLKRGSINFYMFQGGTNFGFFTGNSDTVWGNISQITSYDYDAPLTEWGAPTEKYYELQKMIKEELPHSFIAEPKIPTLSKFESVNVKEKTSLFSNLDTLPMRNNDYTLSMEDLDQNHGYVLYESTMLDQRHVEKFKVINANDRVQVYVNDEHKTTQYLDDLGKEISFDLDKDENNLKVLVECLSRNNYGKNVVSHTQNKGIRSGVMEDIHYIANWNHYSLDFKALDKVDYRKDFDVKTPSYYKFEFELDEVDSTFIDVSQYGKGYVFVNGFNLGRYWEVGPTQYLYAPFSLWNKGKNEVVVFETEGVDIERLDFSDEPIYELKSNLPEQ